jgi:hypothetical protein
VLVIKVVDNLRLYKKPVKIQGISDVKKILEIFKKCGYTVVSLIFGLPLVVRNGSIDVTC